MQTNNKQQLTQAVSSDELQETTSDELQETTSDELIDFSSDELQETTSNELIDFSSDELQEVTPKEPIVVSRDSYIKATEKKIVDSMNANLLEIEKLYIDDFKAFYRFIAAQCCNTICSARTTPYRFLEILSNQLNSILHNSPFILSEDDEPLLALPKFVSAALDTSAQLIILLEEFSTGDFKEHLYIPTDDDTLTVKYMSDKFKTTSTAMQDLLISMLESAPVGVPAPLTEAPVGVPAPLTEVPKESSKES